MTVGDLVPWGRGPCVRTRLTAIAAAIALSAGPALGAEAAGPPGAIPAHVATAVADAGRPEADRARDAARRPGEIVAFAGVASGWKVAELLPGGGYFTRILSKAVGANGKVYTVVPAQAPAQFAAPSQAIAADPAYANVTLLRQAMTALQPPEPLDLVWTTQNYHDLHNNNGDPDAVNRAVFAALKPGGIYLVSDHNAPTGWGASATQSHHRIAREHVIREVLAAGFVLDGENWALWNPPDVGILPSSDASVRGATNQFVLRFKKPA